MTRATNQLVWVPVPYRLYPLAVHLVVSVRTREGQACIPLLVDEEVREIHLETQTVRQTDGQTNMRMLMKGGELERW